MYLPESWGDTGSTIRCGEGGLRNDSKIRQSYDKPSARLGDDLFRSEIVALGGLGFGILHGLILDLAEL
jgi:hypothetical protein